jgi:heterokaryon incompatibility protein (HET)
MTANGYSASSGSSLHWAESDNLITEQIVREDTSDTLLLTERPWHASQAYYPAQPLKSIRERSASPALTLRSDNAPAPVSGEAAENHHHSNSIKRWHSVNDSEKIQALLKAQQEGKEQGVKRSVSSTNRVKLPINTQAATATRLIPSYPKSSSVLPSTAQNLPDEELQSFLESYKAPQRVSQLSQPTNRQRDLNRSLDHWKWNFPLDRLIYQPLPKGYFRLLVIHPASEGQMVHCDLYKVNLADAIEYEALSYVWGTEPATFEIKVNEQSLMVRPNLHDALRRLRGSKRVCVWVDSLCINQADPFEKTEQIRNMGQIYRKAKSVCIWLGEEDQYANTAFELVDTILGVDFLYKRNLVDDYEVVALYKVLERPWFRRLWVLQEASSARNAIMLCGSLAIRMDHLINAVILLRHRLKSSQFRLHPSVQKAVNILNESPGLQFLDAVTVVFHKSGDGEIVQRVETLESLTEMTAFLETTDLRDTIYALLNLARDSKSYPISPDYKADLLSVFTHFIQFSVNDSKSLDIILRPWAPISISSDPNGPVDAELKTNRPSWICSRNSLPFGNPSEGHKSRLHPKSLVGGVNKRIYNANYGVSAPCFFGSHETVNLSKYDMLAYGLILGVIQEQSMRMADGIVQKDSLDVIGGIHRDEDGYLYDLSDQVWRILCANRDGNGKPAPGIIYRQTILGFFNNPPPSKPRKDLDVEDLLKEDLHEDAISFLRVVRDTVWNRRAFRGIGDFGELLGLSPRYARVDDYVCILYGCSVPVILRPPPKNHPEGRWHLIGEAYVDGMMDGEVFWRMSQGERTQREVTFIIR